jgi:hypothetical protein
VHTLKDIAPYLAVAACALTLVVAVLLALVWRGLRKLRRAQTVIMGRHEERDLIAHAEHIDGRVQNLREAVEILTGKLDEHKVHLDEALTNRAVVRYDAFRDSGGEQSSSLALLDNYRSGLVISTISARDFARLYVKTLDRGSPDRELSPEEEQAVRAAVPRPLTPVAEPPVRPAPGVAAQTPARPASAAEPPLEARPAIDQTEALPGDEPPHAGGRVASPPSAAPPEHPVDAPPVETPPFDAPPFDAPPSGSGRATSDRPVREDHLATWFDLEDEPPQPARRGDRGEPQPASEPGEAEESTGEGAEADPGGSRPTDDADAT